MPQPETYDGFRYCAHQGDSAPIGAGGLPRWPHKRITWRVLQPLPQFANDAYRAAIAEAGRRWAEACGIEWVEAQQGETANLAFYVVSQTPGGMLAQCYLPYQGITPQHSLRCEVDKAEGAAWCISDNPPSSRLDLVRVLTHEIGHGLGVSHLGEQSGCLMAPVYSSKIGWPQAGDIAEVVARYGQPVEQPKQPEIPTTPNGEAELLRIFQRGGRVIVRFADGREVTA